ncbi:hypothetical protein [Kitasatospora sp. NPDC088346]|uniref:hypothetical protein n=1 Tax=Kitasatospora sp. NPDC088346 TaxID=3364073 RepID=UPI0037F93AE5
MTVRFLNDADATVPAPAETPDGEGRRSTREGLGRYAEQGGFTLTTETNPWIEAADHVAGAEDARAATTVLAELRNGDIRAVGAAVTGLAAKAGLNVPETLHGLNLLLDVFQRVQRASGALRADVYEADLESLIAATADGRWRKQRGVKLSLGQRWALRSQAKSLTVGGRTSRADLHAALTAAAAARTDWAALADDDATARPVVPVGGTLIAETAQAVESLGTAVRALGRLLPERDLEALPLGELADLVDRLAADEGTLYRLPALHTARQELVEAGLESLLIELAERQADRDAALAAYDREVGAEADAEAEEQAARQALAAGPRGEEPPAAVEAAEPEAAEVEAADVGIEAAEPVAEVAVEAEAETAEVVAEVEVEPVAVEEPVVEPEAVAVEPEPVVEAEAEVEPVAVEEPVVEPEAEVEPVAVEEPVVEAEPVAVELEPVVEAEPVAEVAVEAEAETAEVVAEVEVEPVAVEEPVVEPEAEAEAVAEVEVEVEPVAVEEPVVEVEPVAVEPEPVVAEQPAEVPVEAPKKARRPKKPELTAGRPVTAYSAAELTALVRWIDGDGVERSEDELLRAAMKELGFARLGPRIKEALGAAVTEARG